MTNDGALELSIPQTVTPNASSRVRTCAALNERLKNFEEMIKSFKATEFCDDVRALDLSLLCASGVVDDSADLGCIWKAEPYSG